MARAPKAHPNAALIAAAQAALPLARDADEKGAAPIIINAGTSSVTLTDRRGSSGKGRREVIGKGNAEAGFRGAVRQPEGAISEP